MIGVIDSGVGGLTVVKSLQEVYPNLDILFIGDSKNCPYGSKPKEKLIELGNNMINYLKDQNISQIIFGCNTLSTLANEFDSDIIDLITPTRKYIELNDIRNIGVLGTPNTIKSNCYNILGRTRMQLSDINLAFLIDNLDFDDASAILDQQINQLKEAGCKTILLGCTHYPILSSSYLDLEFIDPGKILASSCLINKKDGNGEIKILTTGEVENYSLISRYINIKNIKSIEHVTL